MSLRSLLASGRPRSRAARRRARLAPSRRSFVPRLELLENRTVPSGYQQINLVGEVPGVAPQTDPNLDGWGMDTTPNGFVVADARPSSGARSARRKRWLAFFSRALLRNCPGAQLVP